MCFLQLLCAFCCFVDASPRFCCLSPLCCATSAVVCVTFAPCLRLYLVFLRASSSLFGVVSSVFLVLPPLLPLWCVVSWLLLCCGAGDLVSLCVGCFVCVVCCFWCVVGCWWCVLLLVARCVVLLLLVLFCFGLSAVLWSSWCWLCVVALLSVLLLLVAVGLLVGCRGCVALSAFLLLVVLWLLVCFPSWLVLLCVAPSWLVHVAPGSCVALLVVLGGSWSSSAVLCSWLIWCWLVLLVCWSSWFFFLTFFATPGCGVACVWFCLCWFSVLPLVWLCP